MPTRQQAVAALDTIMDPCSIASGRPLSVIGLGLVAAEDIVIDGDRVEVGLVLTDPMCSFYRNISTAIQTELTAIGFARVDIATRPQLWEPGRMKVKEAS